MSPVTVLTDPYRIRASKLWSPFSVSFGRDPTQLETARRDTAARPGLQAALLLSHEKDPELRRTLNDWFISLVHRTFPGAQTLQDLGLG